MYSDKYSNEPIRRRGLTGTAGLDAAVKTLDQAAFGKFLLIAAALGLAAFGAYSFVRSRHGRM
jgi:hypothetical protein